MYRLLLLPLLVVFVFSVQSVRAQEVQFDPICQSGQSKEECAVRKLNHGLLPPEEVKETEDAGVKGWLTQLQQLASGVMLFFTGADNLKDAYLPFASPSPTTAEGPDATKVLGTTSDPEQGLTNTLAGPEGYYGATLPTEEQLPEGIEKPTGTGLQIGPITLPMFSEINQDEKFYEQAYFPQEVCYADGTCEKVCPITGQCTN